jgi:hypothetical protein
MHPLFCHNTVNISEGDYTLMPQQASFRSLLTPLHRQATKALAALRQEITRREKELAGLKVEMARWQNVVNGRVARSARAALLAPSRSPKKLRLDWVALLQKLPARFTAKEVAEKTGRPPAHAYLAVSRWMKGKRIIKDKNGYRKLSTARSSE